MKRVDIDGKVEVLDAVNINHPILSNMKLIPNPKSVKKATTISCESLICSDGVMHVYDVNGESCPLSEVRAVTRLQSM